MKKDDKHSTRAPVTIQISKQHLDLIDKELMRLHQLLSTGDEPNRKFAIERIKILQDGLILLQDITSSIDKKD